jgi:hypothetical protein
MKKKSKVTQRMELQRIEPWTSWLSACALPSELCPHSHGRQCFFFWYIPTTHNSIHVHVGTLHALPLRAVGCKMVKQISCVMLSVMPKGRQIGSAVTCGGGPQRWNTWSYGLCPPGMTLCNEIDYCKATVP